MTVMETSPIAVAISVIIGVVVGMGYFAGLWITVQHLRHAKRPVMVWAASALLRAAGATVVFVVLMGWGIPHIIAGVLGFIGARLIATRIWGPCREPRMPAAHGQDGER